MPKSSMASDTPSERICRNSARVLLDVAHQRIFSHFQLQAISADPAEAQGVFYLICQLIAGQVQGRAVHRHGQVGIASVG